MNLHDLLSLPHLHLRQIAGKEPLINYSQSHIMISNMNIQLSCKIKLWIKQQHIKERRQKERGKNAKKSIDIVAMVGHVIKKVVEYIAKA